MTLGYFFMLCYEDTLLTGNNELTSVNKKFAHSGRKKGPHAHYLKPELYNCKLHTYIHTQANVKETGILSAGDQLPYPLSRWNDCVTSCITQNWAASWQGSQLLLDVFSVSDTSPRPLSLTKEKSYIWSCKTVCDAAHPNRITGFHSKQMKEKQRQHPSLLTDGGHTLQEVVSWAGIQNEHAHMHFFFQTRTLSRFYCVSAFSLREGDEWFWDSLWWLSSPAETSSHFHFCCFFAHFPTRRHWHNDYCNQRDSLAIGNNTKPMFFLSLYCCYLVYAGVQGSEVNFCVP